MLVFRPAKESFNRLQVTHVRGVIVGNELILITPKD